MHVGKVAFLVLLGAAASGLALAQGTDPFERASCQEDFLKLKNQLEQRGLAVKKAGDRKADAPEVCRLLRNYVGTEAKMVKFLTEKQSVCGIPDQVINQSKEGHTKSIATRNRVCKVAAGPPAPPPPAPSQGLSSALGSSPASGTPPEVRGGSGVFDTLTGNVLRQ